MMLTLPVWLRLVIPAIFAGAVTFLLTPPIKDFAQRLGAYDYPDELRRVNKTPIPRMGGLAIGIAFTVTVLLFSPMDSRVAGMLAGALTIVAMGTLDDIAGLKPVIKLLVQILAALIACRSGIVLQAVSSFNILSESTFLPIGKHLMIPVTVLWVVACTNALNLIDGLDGLAVGVAGISSLTMMVAALSVSEPSIAALLAVIIGSCVGFLPYNLNPAKIFMGDVGAQLLGYLLGVISIMGLFKLHALISLIVPLLALAVPLGDTAFAFFRRILKGQNPFTADNGHIHHRLLAYGLNQKQAVAILYAVSALMGMLAVTFANVLPAVRIACICIVFVAALLVWIFVIRVHKKSTAAGEAATGAEEVRK